MTKAKVSINGIKCTLEMDGHATGSDLVCAYCSSIACTLAGFLANSAGHLYGELEQEISPGRCKIVCRGDSDVRAVFRAAGIGLLQAAHDHPDFVQADFCDNAKNRGETCK